MSLSPFPARAVMRNGKPAAIAGIIQVDGGKTNMLQGSHEESGYELWLTSGRYSYSAREHPFDLVQVRSTEGHVVVLTEAIPA